jgi:type III restriction enzyme
VRHSPPTKCIFDLVPCDNEFEKEFALFLQKAPDMTYSALPSYRNNSGAQSSTSIALPTCDTTSRISSCRRVMVFTTFVETKGLEDTNVANKDREAQLWCENTTRLAGKPWAYL